MDPFLGTGTTSLVAKANKLNSVGIEAHSFVFDIAKTKLFWEYNYKKLEKDLNSLIKLIENSSEKDWGTIKIEDAPELLRKCYSDKALRQLYFISVSIKEGGFTKQEKKLFDLALINSLRLVSAAGTGWPYIAPSKFGSKKSEKDVFSTFLKVIRQMYSDLDSVRNFSDKTTSTKIILGDARMDNGIPANSVDLVVTSPPYLNNYDYADRTRLETYFCGVAKNWGEITSKIRSKLMIASTTQVFGSSDRNIKLNKEIYEIDPSLFDELSKKIEELSEIKKTRKGKKNYDWLVTGYFNDMYDVLKQLAKIMKKGGKSFWVLGDSAPYGIHIKTEEYIGRLAIGMGFKRYEIEVLRSRGEKWAKNPQRHNVKLKESILTITR